MNRLSGVICGTLCHDGIALIDVETAGIVCSAIQIGQEGGFSHYRAGAAVTLCFKEFEVSLARDLQGMISLRNRFHCHVTDIERGVVMSRVLLDFCGHVLSSVITTRSVDNMHLAVGDEVDALVKANEMNILLSE